MRDDLHISSSYMHGSSLSQGASCATVQLHIPGRLVVLPGRNILYDTIDTIRHIPGFLNGSQALHGSQYYKTTHTPGSGQQLSRRFSRLPHWGFAPMWVGLGLGLGLGLA